MPCFAFLSNLTNNITHRESQGDIILGSTMRSSFISGIKSGNNIVLFAGNMIHTDGRFLRKWVERGGGGH